MQIEEIKISEIKLNPNNPRIVKDEKFDKLVKSIQDFPEMLKIRPIVVNSDMITLGGNMRLKAAKKAGLKKVPIIRAENLSEEQQREFIIKDNIGYGEWEWNMLQSDWNVEQLVEWGLDFNFENEKILEAEEDNFEIPDEIKSDIVIGDLFEIGNHRLLCGDSTDSDAVEKLMNNKYAELLFTSPPYSDMRDYNGNKDLSVDYLSEFITTYFQHCEYQVINLGIQRKENDIIQYWNTYIDKAKDNGYKFLAWNVWHKSGVSIGQQSSFIPIYHEWIFVFGKKFKHINRTKERNTPIANIKNKTRRQKDGSMKKSSVGIQEEKIEMQSVFYSSPELGKIRDLHPATFPVELPAEYIQAITNEGDIIVEPFCGSGTTMVASHQLNRTCYAMELDEKYCQVIIDRMKKLDSSLVIKKNGIVIE